MRFHNAGIYQLRECIVGIFNASYWQVFFSPQVIFILEPPFVHLINYLEELQMDPVFSKTDSIFLVILSENSRQWGNRWLQFHFDKLERPYKRI